MSNLSLIKYVNTKIKFYVKCKLRILKWRGKKKLKTNRLLGFVGMWGEKDKPQVFLFVCTKTNKNGGKVRMWV